MAHATERNRSPICPFCGSETGIERETYPVLGAVALDELEVLVRNEWRRRLGPEAYGRNQSRAVIRALIVYGLAPESPVRETVLRETIAWECTRLAAQGIEPAARRREVHELGRAVHDTLRAIPSEAANGARRLSDPIEAMLAKLLGAPDAAERT